MSPNVTIKPEILEWAISRAGMQKKDIVGKKDYKWLNEDKQPTLKQLEKFAKKVHIPLGFLFFDEPLQEEVPIPDFRKTADFARESKLSLNLRDTIDYMVYRKEWLSEFMRREGEEAFKYKNILERKDIYQATEYLNKILKPIQRQINLSELKSQVEKTGVFVFINGVVGNSNNRKLDVNEFRGFALTDDYAPVIFINGSDSDNARKFTLIHELVHILRGSEGITGNPFAENMDAEETYCNKVAASYLMPEERTINIYKAQNGNIESTASKIGLSSLAVATRLVELNRISRDRYKEFIQSARPSKEAKSSSSVRRYSTLQNNRVGKKFARIVAYAVKSDKLLYRDAYRLTGLTGSTFENYLNEIRK